jgi:hypothetical protein
MEASKAEGTIADGTEGGKWVNSDKYILLEKECAGERLAMII